jgi:hypothetical protein
MQCTVHILQFLTLLTVSRREKITLGWSHLFTSMLKTPENKCIFVNPSCGLFLTYGEKTHTVRYRHNIKIYLGLSYSF